MKQRLCIGFWLGLGILTLSGCSRATDEELWPAEGVPLQVAGVNIGSGLVTTRANTLNKGAIGFFTKVSGTDDQANVCYNFGTPYWKAANPSESILLETGTTYCAYYPWRAGVAVDKIPMTALPSEAEQDLSYLIYQAASKGAVNLELKRAYCRLNLNLTWTTGQASDQVTSISLEKEDMPATATLNAGTGVVTPVTTTNRLTQAIDIKGNSVNKTAVFFVCPMNLDAAKVSIVLNGKTLTASINPNTAIESGKWYNINITLNAQTLTFGNMAEKPNPDGWTNTDITGGDLKP